MTQIGLTRYYILIPIVFSPQVPRIFSKASTYAASRCADLADTRFWIGSKNTRDTQTLTKSLADTWILRGLSLIFAKFLLILEVISNLMIRGFWDTHFFFWNQKQFNSRSYCIFLQFHFMVIIFYRHGTRIQEKDQLFKWL